MATIKNTPRYLNTDSDERVLQTTEMSDALNIRITAEDNGDAGVVKNVDGNTLLGSFSGHNVVGTYEHEGTNRLFVFVRNDIEVNASGFNSIWELNQGDSSFTKIIESNNIRFSGDPLNIDGMLINNELHLYFTDGVNEPQKVNVDTDVTLGTYPVTELEANVMKKAPQAPTVSILTDSNKKTNELYGKAFQFALQHVFRDGEVSAIGEYSEVITGSNTLNGLSSSQTYRLSDNKILIEYDSSVLDLSLGIGVPKVRAFYKKPEDNTMYYIGEYTYAEISNGVDFYNNKSYPVVSDSEYNKTIDNVPKSTQTQAISANRLFYGNYKEGFNKANVSASLTAVYNEEPLNTSLDISVSATGNGEDSIGIFIDTQLVEPLLSTGALPTTIDFQFVNLTVNELTGRAITFLESDGTTVAQAFTTDDHEETILHIQKKRYTQSTSVSASSTLSDYNTKLASALNGTNFSLDLSFGSAKYDASSYSTWYDTWKANFTDGTVNFEITATANANGNGVDVEIDPTSFTVSGVIAVLNDTAGLFQIPLSIRDYVTSLSGSFGSIAADRWMSTTIDDNFSSAVAGTSTNKTFKSGESHSLGVVFEDQLGRTSGVCELGSVDIDRRSERLNKGQASIESVITASGLDSSFTNFFYVYSGGNNIDDYVQYSVPNAFVLDTANNKAANEDEAEGDLIYVSLRALQGANNSYCETNDINYSFTKGDKLRIVSYIDNDARTYPSDFEFDVVRLETVEEDKFVIHSSSTYEEKVHHGEFVVVKSTSSSLNFSYSETLSFSSDWDKDVIIELYTPSKEQETKIYYAISGKYSVSTEIGQTQTLTEGNAWYKKRIMRFDADSSSEPWTFSNAVHYVESNQYFDVESSTKGKLGGKPYAVIANEKEHSRISSITYSEPQLADSAQNNLSSFNASLANFADYEMNYGGIYGLVDMSDSIIILQSDKVSRIPLNRQILATGTGSELVTQSTDILGLQQHYSGNFGINEDRTAFLNDDGTVYLVDVTRSKIVAITQQGVKVLNDLGVDSWINDRTGSMLGDTDGYFVSIGIDKDNDEVYFSLQNLPLTSYSESMVYSKQLDKFTSKSSVAAPYFGTLGLRFFSFRDDDAWEQNTNNTKGSFYGSQEDSYFEVSFNQSPSLNKVFHALSIEGTADADVEVTTSNNQNLTIPQESFKLREGEYYTKVGRSDSDFNKIVIGKVASINGDNVTFYNRVNRIPFRLGGDAFVQSGSTYTSVAGTSVSGVVDAYTLSFVNASNLSADTIVAISGEGVIDGEPMRGSYATGKFTFDDTDTVEVFAVNASVAESNLHNSNTSQ
jgi:hypothetical protein